MAAPYHARYPAPLCFFAHFFTPTSLAKNIEKLGVEEDFLQCDLLQALPINGDTPQLAVCRRHLETAKSGSLFPGVAIFPEMEV